MANFYQLDHDAQARAMAELAGEALPAWDLQGCALDLIKYRENAVFRVTAPDGAQYALRIHRHGYHSDDELRSELQWMAALDESGIAVPTLVPDRAGDLFRRIEVSSVPEPRQVDLFEWVEGTQLGSVEEGLGNAASVGRTYHTIGALAARLHNQAVAWTPPPGFTRHAWDAEGLVGEAPFWGPFWELAALDGEQRELLQGARERVRRELAAYAGDSKVLLNVRGLGADFVAENLMVHGDEVRLIDFDDAGFGWHLFELATALYFEMGEEHYPAAYQALVDGYRAHRSLPDEQLAHMPLFFMARSFTYLGWVHTRSETQTARELTPMLVERCCDLAREYLEA